MSFHAWDSDEEVSLCTNNFSSSGKTKSKDTLVKKSAFWVSDRPAMPEDEQVVLDEAVSSWRLCVCSFLKSYINSQRLAKCWITGSVTVFIWSVTSSDVTDKLGDVSISWSYILLGVFPVKFSVSLLLSVASVSTATVLFIIRKRSWVQYLVVKFIETWGNFQ